METSCKICAGYKLPFDIKRIYRLYKALDYIDAEPKKITNKSEIKKIKNTNFELVRNIQEMSISNAVNSNNTKS